MNRNTLIACFGLLLAGVLGLALADNDRAWKRLQSEALELERQDLDSRLAKVQDQQRATLAEQRARIEAEEDRLVERRDEITELEADLRGFRSKAQAAELRLTRSRMKLENLRQQLAAPGTTTLVEMRQKTRLARMEVEGFQELIADRERKLEAVRSDLTAAHQRWSEAQAPIEAIERRRQELGEDPIPALAKIWSPAIAVREVPVVDFPEAAGAPRLDRCVTCHHAAAREGLVDETWPAHARSHPNPELFLSADSPHPYQRFGCTVCHGGHGRSTDFSRAGHTPRTADQEAAWATDHGWRQASLPARPMLPLDMTEAACGQCHPSSAVSETLEAGRLLVAAMGCTGCHAAPRNAVSDSPKVGPSLIGIAGKTRTTWTYHWLAGSTAPRTNAWVSHLLASDPTVSEAERERESIEARAIVNYLWQTSRAASYENPEDGDVEAGRMLFESVGCDACHVVAPTAANSDRSLSTISRRHGPDLSRIGSKVEAGWLAAWLRDPHAYRPDSAMPNLRLTDQETADLVAYLMTRRDPEWEGLELPPLAIEARDALVLSHLERSHGIEASQARLEAMGERERNRYLGRWAIAQRGCHGCHAIPGFEAAPAPTAPSLLEVADPLRLNTAGRKARDLHRWRPEAHTPAYPMSDAEAKAVTIAILGLATRPELERRVEAPEAELSAGRRLVSRYNCRGCHVIEGRGGWGTGAFDPSAQPPDLAHAGARLSSPWLFSYLADPGRSRQRPWLTVRMPSFAFNEAELNTLTRYFATLDGRELLTHRSPAGTSAKTSLAVGQVVFGMLQCDSCHSEASDSTHGFEPAPAYHLARDRLRPDWVVDWILDPEKWRPGTAMPSNFLTGVGANPDSSFLIGSISTPIFSPERDRLRRVFGSEDELHAYLADPEKVAMALRDYLWTLAE